VRVSMRLANVEGNVLVAGEPYRSLDEYYQAPEPIIDYERTFSPDDLKLKPRELGIETARHFYAAFGWLDPVDFVLHGLQEEALK
jgi:hypothetical protein